ncbi:MAG: phosphatidylglycerophosphatase A [Candidatus Omnitrophica bacterium]|nr:phosphatidylglycerophosphatase A [Candidatus Omnitrophota bacterium]
MEKPVSAFAKIIATFFGTGYFPAAPGTAATAAGAALAFLLKDGLVYYAAAAVIFSLGTMASGIVEKDLKQKDPGIVVIDEVAGVLIAFMGIPMSWPVVICGFFLFRAFDMFKIYPINRLEALPGGWGIMLDDVMAGLYTNIVLSIALRWAGVI